MTRRDSIKNIAITGGLLAFGFSISECSSLTSTSSFFTRKEQKLLAAIADTFIPGDKAAKAIGALDVGVDVLLEKLLEKCYEEDVQTNVKTQLAALDDSAQTIYGKRFANCNQIQREALLLARANSEIEAEKEFFKLMKSDTIRGFRTSQEVMTKYLDYQVAPGHYYGCVDVNAVM